MIVGKTGKMRDVALGIRLRYKSGRDMLTGITRYASRNLHWRIHVINVMDRNTVDEFRAAIARGVDGFILHGVVFPEITSLLGKTDIPLVAFGARVPELGKRTKSLAFIRNDDYKVGVAGADYLMSLGAFRSYVYIPTNQPSYASDLRKMGYRDRLGEKGIEVREFPIDPARMDGGYEEVQAMAAWLKGLPKPIAAMAAFDARAVPLLEAAQEGGVRVPSQMAVLGVDNDDLVCDFTDPPLSSIEPDHTHNGELAAAELERMMANGGGNIVRLRKSTKRRIVERLSAKPVAPAARLVQRGIAYIEKNLTRGVTTDGVVRYLGVSRRLADMRFREFGGSSVHEAIVSRRLEELKRRLALSDASIASVTAACGFRSENYAKNVFKAKFGISMSDWRSGISPQKAISSASVKNSMDKQS